MTDNSEALNRARRQDSNAKRRRASDALDAMIDNGEPITFPTVARRAGVSVSLLYADPALAGRLSEARRRQRDTGATEPRGPGVCRRAHSSPSRACVPTSPTPRTSIRRLNEEMTLLRERLGAWFWSRGRHGQRPGDQPADRSAPAAGGRSRSGQRPATTGRREAQRGFPGGERDPRSGPGYGPVSSWPRSIAPANAKSTRHLHGRRAGRRGATGPRPLCDLRPAHKTSPLTRCFLHDPKRTMALRRRCSALIFSVARSGVIVRSLLLGSAGASATPGGTRYRQWWKAVSWVDGHTLHVCSVPWSSGLNGRSRLSIGGKAGRWSTTAMWSTIGPASTCEYSSTAKVGGARQERLGPMPGGWLST